MVFEAWNELSHRATKLTSLLDAQLDQRHTQMLMASMQAFKENRESCKLTHNSVWHWQHRTIVKAHNAWRHYIREKQRNILKVLFSMVAMFYILKHDSLL